jgi:hypothetical protein
MSADEPMLVYIVSVINLSRRQATIISSEIGESFEISVAASRRWCALEAEECLFIVRKAERAGSQDRRRRDMQGF